MTVNEKQTGVRFDGVRKVYNTDQGEIVAVDDFTLKLSEGEVTSLLGRNGAGKTTIMYVCLYINTKYLNRYDREWRESFSKLLFDKFLFLQLGSIV